MTTVGQKPNAFSPSSKIEGSLVAPNSKAITIQIIRKLSITFIGILVTINSTLRSSLSSNEISYITDTFLITDKNVKILPIFIYLVRYVFGPIVFAPLSELYSRRWITISTFSLFTLFTIAAALALSWSALLIFRLLAGIGVSAPISVIGGIYADIYESPIARLTIYKTIGFGPLMSPIIAGCSAPTLGWRWSFWIALIIAGASFAGLIFLPETYGPTVMIAQPKTLFPLRILFTKPIVIMVCLYLAILYGIFYMFFSAYLIIFQRIYEISPCKSSTIFLPIRAGDLVVIALGAMYNFFLEQSQASKKSSIRREEVFRLPPACFGVPWAVPFASGFIYRVGTQLIFIGLLNYLANAYTIYAASAFAASSCSRSIFSALLPLATSTLSFAILLMSLMPFVLIKYGSYLRNRSKLKKEREDREAESSAQE
ncbi:MFS general substrate transporter [Cadophora sp. DSE1049]|nr:MFS general substrate transporter [Cadophora sp. DSE1049]